jgi:hypothetical protein
MRLPARIGLILIIVGVMIFIGQTTMLLMEKQTVAQRGQVLAGTVEKTGFQSARPVLSVVGVFCVAGGLFAYALSSGRKP